MTTLTEIEKGSAIDAKHHEQTGPSTSLDYDARINAFTAEQQKKIMRRIDFRLVPTLGFMYCVSLMDRTNLGIAAIAGMAYDLRTSVGSRYSLITLVFFFTYVFLQPPATVVLRKVGPKLFLPSTCLAWGVLTLGFGFVHQWWEMLPLRLVLGVLEAGFFPGKDVLIVHVSCSKVLRLRIPPFLLVPQIRTSKAKRRFLLDWKHGICLFWNHIIRFHANEHPRIW